jgi:S1-C subfamily serine protease
MVLVVVGNRYGTGFYTSSDGDVVTASHVLGDRSWNSSGTGMTVTMTGPPAFEVRNDQGKSFSVPKADLEVNGDAWGADVARIKTRTVPPCWLEMGNDALARPGQHIITLGFPSLAFGSLTMYSGIISARLKSELPVGKTNDGKAVLATNDVLRVQMPISPGISGAAVIDDDNRVIAVVTAAGAWSAQLDFLAQLSRMGAFQNAPQNNLDLTAAVAQFAQIFHDYGSPGYGDSVPLSYLKTTAQSNPKPESTGRQ